jgi:uncharacterized protein YndB with AHSA1/START domain
MTASHNARPGNETEITMTRVFDAPRELVFKAWTDPEQLARWWGPHGFTNPVCETDPRPGGRWRIDMRGPDGTIYPNKGRYLEVVVPERIVYTDDVDDDATAWGDAPPPSTVQTVTFEDVGGGTRVTVVVRVDSVEARDAMIEMGAVIGWTESMERLEALLAAA